MAEDKTKPVSVHPGRINVDDAREIRYWTKKCGCTEDQLVCAVDPTATKYPAGSNRKNLKGARKAISIFEIGPVSVGSVKSSRPPGFRTRPHSPRI